MSTNELFASFLFNMAPGYLLNSNDSVFITFLHKSKEINALGTLAG